MNRDYPLEKVRNIGIIAHNDASSRLRAGLFETLRFQYIHHGETLVSPTPFPRQCGQEIG